MQRPFVKKRGQPINIQNPVGPEQRHDALSRLGRQSGLAAMVFFFPWLLTVFLCRSLIKDRPATLLALLPGLTLAIYMQRHLRCHLSSNHRLGEPAFLFPTLGAANWITLVRAGAIVGLAGFLALAVQDRRLADGSVLAWLPGILYLAISLADLCDGFVARKQNRVTALGKRLDIETDAAGLWAAGLLAIVLGRLPVVYILVGVAYYPFVLGIQWRQKRALPVVALRPRPYSRIIAGCQMGLVSMVLLPVFNPRFTFAAAYIFMTPLLLGFLRDWLVVSCRIRTDDDQQARLDHWLGSLASKLPLFLRLAILVSGIHLAMDCNGYPIPLAWQLAPGLCWVGAVAGFMGRCASLVLILLLGSSPSPLGIFPASMALFAFAAALMLGGTGPLSLWAPGERILYRRSRSAGMGSGDTP